MKPVSTIRKIAIFPITLIAFALIISAQNAPPADKEQTLTDAIKSGSIEADVRSVGKHSGKSVKLTVTNKTDKSIKVTVPEGTAYVPDEDEEQTLIQLEEDFFVLEPRESKSHMIAAFCTEASDKSPSSGGEFTISKSSNKKLNEVIAYMKGKTISKRSYQDVVWAITDGHSVSNIEIPDPQTQKFRKYLADLTGQKDTWYTSPQRHTINAQRQIVSETTVISGQLEFPSDGTSVIRQEVVDKDGVVRYARPPRTPGKSKKVTMQFTMRVRGMEAGEYTVRVLKDDVVLKTYPFTLS